jgi:hypothetical protein
MILCEMGQMKAGMSSSLFSPGDHARSKVMGAQVKTITHRTSALFLTVVRVPRLSRRLITTMSQGLEDRRLHCCQR